MIPIKKIFDFLLKAGLASFCFLATFEILLRTTHFFYQDSRGIKNQISADDDSKLRILAVGESTTDGNRPGDPQISWPKQLENILNQNGIPARVYNEGRGAVNSYFLAQKFKEQIEKYRPHIVIAMMGINDGFKSLEFAEGDTKPPVYAKLKSYELMMWIQYFYFSKANSLFQLKSDIEAANFTDCLNFSREATSQGYRFNLSELSLIQQCAASDRNHESEWNSILMAQPLMGIFKRSENALAKNYNYLADLSRTKKIQFVAMQYPTRSIESLKSYFANEKQNSIIFIENKENFRRALSERTSEEIFTDHFATDFGHATTYGNELIAQKAFQELKKLNVLQVK